jgi:hypothetical protein
MRRVTLIALFLSLASGCDSCKKKETEPEVVAPPSLGGASQEMVSTSIGNGLGLPANIAPTSTEWDRVVVIDDNTALVFGRVLEEAIAIRTTDRGRTWTALGTKAGAWQSWGTASDGAAVLVSGDRKKMQVAAGKEATVEKARVWFGPADGELGEPGPLFPDEEALAGVELLDGIARPAMLARDRIALIADQRRQPLMIFGAPGGDKAPPPMALPRGRWVRAPYGRPANLLSVTASKLEVRPWPKPAAAIDPGSPVPGLAMGHGMAEQLDAGPHCESGAWSFAKLSAGPVNTMLVGVSDTRALAFKLPNGTTPLLGCTSQAIVVENVGAQGKDAGPAEPQLVRCALEGAKCAEPKSNPFEIWPEPHERKLLAVPTEKGVVATLTMRTGNRQAAFVGTSMDAGETFELSRVIGKTETGRGFFEIGALIAFDDRVVMLLTADVTGTRGRRWYAMASDDSGQNWGPP